MIESPWLDEVKQIIADEAAVAALRSAIVELFEARFGALPMEVIATIDALTDKARLRKLVVQAACCPDLDSFVSKLNEGV